MRLLDGTERVIELFNSGLTQSEVAAKLGRSQHYVSKRLLRTGISRSRKATNAIKQSAKPFLPDKGITGMYASGMSSNEIAACTGRSHSHILKHARAAGIARSRGQSLRIIAQRNAPIIRMGDHGYYVFSHAGRDRYLHRSIMESAIGRKLGKHEVVHHVNHDKTDNRIANLSVTSPSEHTRHHHFLGLKCIFCGNDAYARALCKPHYQQVDRAGQLRLFPKQSNAGRPLRH